MIITYGRFWWDYTIVLILIVNTNDWLTHCLNHLLTHSFMYMRAYKYTCICAHTHTHTHTRMHAYENNFLVSIDYSVLPLSCQTCLQLTSQNLLITSLSDITLSARCQSFSYWPIGAALSSLSLLTYTIHSEWY